MVINVQISIHTSNRAVMSRILSLVDFEGKAIISQTQAAILELVGRYPQSNGNFMNEDTFLNSLPGRKICRKTLRNNIEYLFYLKVLAREIDKEKRLVLKLREPAEGPKENMANFRRRMGFYKYEKAIPGQKQVDDRTFTAKLELPEKIELEAQKMPENNTKQSNQDDFDALFNEKPVEKISKTEEFFSQTDGKNFPETWKFFPHYNKEEERPNEQQKTTSTESKKEHHPIVPPLAVSSEFTSEEPAEKNVIQKSDKLKRKKRVQSEEPELSPESEIKKKANREPKVAEPLLDAPKKKKARQTGKERLAEAMEVYSQGHVTNPIGKADTRGRTLQPSKARPIGTNGSVTIAQLWKAYLYLFEQAFGETSFLETVMPSSREYVTNFFAQLKQKFLDYTGKAVDNRTVYDYLVWIHDPQRLAYLVGNKHSASKEFLHPLQLMGAVSIKRFSDQYIGQRQDTLLSEGVKKARELTKALSEAFDLIREKHEDTYGMVYCLTIYGFVIVGEYLKDYHGCDASECKKRMIEAMTDFILHAKKKENAKKFVSRAWDRTVANKAIESAVWTNWREACKDFVSVAIERAERLNHEREDKLPSMPDGQGTGISNPEQI